MWSADVSLVSPTMTQSPWEQQGTFYEELRHKKILFPNAPVIFYKLPSEQMELARNCSGQLRAITHCLKIIIVMQ